MDHSYEEIRNAALDVLAGREKARFESSQFEHLHINVAEVLQKRDGHTNDPRASYGEPQLSAGDSLLFQEVFWDLFRQGIITLGMDRANKEFPWFRVSS